MTSCSACNDTGVVKVAHTEYVTRDMATDACDPDLEGQEIVVGYEDCPCIECNYLRVVDRMGLVSIADCPNCTTIDAMGVIEIPEVYDGGLFYQCAICGHRQHRWPEEHELRTLAEPYVNLILAMP